ncbi:coenzyme F420-0:L-glutamate ligase [Nocardioides sp.]|uniref:coenzyme F420-0:L-glutamate ligase n=1 Tax=Nocardioides sp. TaxID=35761 RepID=UPI003D12C8C6
MTLTVSAPDGVPEIRPGDDLAALVLQVLDLVDGDVVAVTSKVVSKAEGRLRHGGREDALAAETARLVARRGATSIVRTRHGLTMAAAGIDASNVDRDWIALLPEDPDESARRLRAGLLRLSGRNVAVIITDTAGRAWRTGQTDIAIGAAGLRVSESFVGRHDARGNALQVTEPAVADELAGAAELAQGKLAARPFALLRGRADLVLPVGDDGPGAAALIRPEAEDLFGYGSREAVIAAVRGTDPRAFGAPVDSSELIAALRRATDAAVTVEGPGLVAVEGDSVDRVALVAFAHGWVVDRSGLDSAIRLRLPPVTP